MSAAAIRYPRPLAPGDTIAVTAPSSGVADHHRPRLDFCVGWLRERGYEVVLGDCLDGSGATSAPPRERAAELTAMLLDPAVAAVVPPWGGAGLAVEILPHLDLEAIAAAAPTWVVGYSDTATILTPLTLCTGLATVHGHNLMDTPYRLPAQAMPWYDVAALPAGAAFTQSAVPTVRSMAAGFDRWEEGPEVASRTSYTLDEPATPWTLLDGGDALDVRGRLIGGCIETLGPLAGTPFGDVAGFAADEGRIVYLEASEDPAITVARQLWSMRLAGWFDDARAVLIGRTRAPGEAGVTQRDAVRSVLGDLDVPVVLDVDCGHVVPALALVNGAVARVTLDGRDARIVQSLV